MSVNLHLAIEIKGYDPSRVDAIKQAIEAILKSEDLSREMSALTESGEGPSRILVSRSNPDCPVIISSAYEWIPEVQAALSKAVSEANGGPCHVDFDGQDADMLDEDEEEA